MMVKTILVAYNAAVIRKMIKDTLCKVGYEVAEAVNGVEAVEKFKEFKADLALVFMDLSMPEMDGLEALNEMRKINTNVPVVLCVAMGQESIGVKAMLAGAQDVIVKPFRPDRVLEAVHKCIG